MTNINITKSTKSNIPPKILTMLKQRRITDLFQRAGVQTQVEQENEAPYVEIEELGMEDCEEESHLDSDFDMNRTSQKWFEDPGNFHGVYLSCLKAIVQNWLLFKSRGHVDFVNLGCIL